MAKTIKNLSYFYDLGWGNRLPVAKTMNNLRFVYVLRWGTGESAGRDHHRLSTKTARTPTEIPLFGEALNKEISHIEHI